MGKYQLDYKGQQSVSKFHEKHSVEGGKGANTQTAQQRKIAELREKVKQKRK